jgi:hypothetical protein
MADDDRANADAQAHDQPPQPSPDLKNLGDSLVGTPPQPHKKKAWPTSKRAWWTARSWKSWRRSPSTQWSAAWGLIYFPDQQRALTGMLRALKAGGKIATVVYSTPENNKFFSIPVSIIRRRTASAAVTRAARSVQSRWGRRPWRGIPTGRLPGSAHAACALAATLVLSCGVRSLRARESFGALHQMLSGLPESERGAVWEEIEEELGQFEGEEGFEGPCEMVVGAGIK